MHERLYRAHVDAGDQPRAARGAFWLALTLAARRSRSDQRLDRAGQRLVEGRTASSEATRVVVAEQQLREGHAVAAHATAGRPSAIGERFEDADLMAAARHGQGRALIEQGDVAAGLSCLDETMLAVVAGELSADHDRADVLQRDRHLPAGLRARPGARVDRGVLARLRATAGHGRVHRRLPGASRRNSCSCRAPGRTR